MASRRHERRRRCGDKVRYDSHAEAGKAASRLRRRSGDFNIRLYKCRFCHKYHIGHYAPYRP